MDETPTIVASNECRSPSASSQPATDTVSRRSQSKGETRSNADPTLAGNTPCYAGKKNIRKQRRETPLLSLTRITSSHHRTAWEREGPSAIAAARKELRLPVALSTSNRLRERHSLGWSARCLLVGEEEHYWFAAR
ncbi:uncharacterized protein LOC116027986 [Ipomoea triloba]|uniref:uncharacterized protein LOC116027986 n=1 Tax=Ipomoea triloba TaxID=35885 RepID=UPI00125D42EA|nr:uncharacterized protein LOC116027986 [Ipomoea triloba]